MKIFQKSLLILFTLAIAISAFAAEPIDSTVKNAIADIERFEKQAEGLTPARKSNARRITKLMNLSYERLKTSENQTDPSWIEVNERYLKLNTQLENLINPPATESAKTEPTPTDAEKTKQPTPTVATTPTQSPAVKSPAPAETSVRPLVSGERVRVKKLTRDMGNITADIVTTGPSPMQDPDKVAAYVKRVKQFEEALVRYPQVEDPDVIAARKAYAAIKEALNAEFRRAKEQLLTLGNVQARLGLIYKNGNAYPAQNPLQLPIGEADATAWVQAASSARTVAEHNLKELAQIAPLAYLPATPGTPETGGPFDASDVDRFQRVAAAKLKDVEESYATMAAALNSQFAKIESSTLNQWQADPEDDDKRWTFIRDGAKKEAFELYDSAIEMAESSIHLETALGREPTRARTIIAKLNQAKEDFVKNEKRALATSRLPQAVSNDKKRLAIAEDILATPRYNFGDHSKIILTTDAIVDRERKDSEIDIDDVDVSASGDLKMSGTQTTWTYTWKEFKFATALKEDNSDEWYIWWITAKNYSSGSSTTPLNKWISGTSTKGNRILKKNL